MTVEGSGSAARALKDDSQLRQKRMMADHYGRLARCAHSGEKNVYTFVPGNLTELVRSFEQGRQALRLDGRHADVAQGVQALQQRGFEGEIGEFDGRFHAA